ncbi:MAG TPA: magnesium transporter [Chloroflexota bacterium]|nr:magnesium transporter [Chloroflexota bacterium]
MDHTTPTLAPPDRASVRAALERRDAGQLRFWAEHRLIELADLLAALDEGQTATAAELLGDELTAEVVAELDPGEAADVLERLDPADAADVLEEMAPDDAADVVEELGESEAADVLAAMESADATALRGILAYPEDTAGHLMTPEFVAVRPDWTVERAIAEMRRQADEAEVVYYVYVTDDAGHLLGVLSLRDLFRARSAQPVTTVMVPSAVRVLATADQEEVARLFRGTRFLALPVVDDQDRLLGIVTVDDVQDVIAEEAAEDMERLGGSQPLDDPYLRAGVFQIVRKRVVWLLLLFAAEAYTGSVLRAFGDELQAVVALAFFIPLLIGTGGNVGSQTITTIIRAMGADEVRWDDLGRVFWKELRVSAVLGTVMATTALARAWTLAVPLRVGTVVALAACAIVLWAGMVAAVLPLVLRRLRIDPAVVSAPMITTLVDGTGLVIYFELARYVLAL